MMRRQALGGLCAPLLLGGCRGLQSALDPQGANAEHIATLGWVMFSAALFILLLVVGLTALAILAPARARRWLGDTVSIVGGGIVFPVVTLSVLLGYGLWVAHTTVAGAPAPVRIEATGEQWWWRVRYPDEQGSPRVVTANEIHMPAGRPVELSLRTADVIHSFWVPNLAGKLDMVPGHVNTLRLRTDRPGVFRGQCAEFCGAQHTWMAFFVVVEAAEEFERWRCSQRLPAREPDTPFLQRGREAFLGAGCGACHTVRGAGADGRLGPDLTHVGAAYRWEPGCCKTMWVPSQAGSWAARISSPETACPRSTSSMARPCERSRLIWRACNEHPHRSGPVFGIAPLTGHGDLRHPGP